MIKRIIQAFMVVYMLFCGSTFADEVPFMEHLISENFKAPDFSFPADIDKDGDIDVAVVSRIGGKIAWFDNNGESPPIFTERIVGYSNDARGVFVTDVNGDGEPDMLTTSALGGQEVIWWESDGAVPPTFSKNTIPANGYDWYPVFATDLDDDGDTDVLVGNGPSGAYSNRVIWLENNGSSPPSFTERVISNAVNWPYSLFATDLDDDGDIDVLSASMWDDKIAWYENDGGSPPGFFQRVISTNVDQASHVTAADIDGDGDIDVLSGANYSPDSKILWFENNGIIPPTFTEQIITNTANLPLFTFPTDVDDDGDIDVLATHMYADKLVWYDNNGDSLPTFTERIIATLVCPPPFTICFAPRNIYGGYDMDGDGDSDVLALMTMNTPVEDPGGKLLWYENKLQLPVEVFIDIKPGSYPNSINLKSNGKIPVAILTTDDFDANDVDPDTVFFAGASPLRWNMEDVDKDGNDDMILHFMTQELELEKESTEATLVGETIDEMQITGTDSVNIVPKGNMQSKKAKKK